MPFDFEGGGGGTITVTRSVPGSPDEEFTVNSTMTVGDFRREYRLEGYTIRIGDEIASDTMRMSDGDVLSCTAPMKAGS